MSGHTCITVTAFLAAGLCSVLWADDKAKSPVAAAPAADAVKSLLEDGFAAGSGKSQSAQKQAAAARRIAPHDPRVDFAYGLVLLKLAQTANAKAQFEAAVKQPGSPFWPAWQASIWSTIADKQYDAGLKRLDEFVVMVARPVESDGASQEQRDAAVWIGQLLEALDRIVETAKTRERIAQSEEHIRKVFSDEMHDAVNAGREAVRDRYEQATGQAALREETQAKKQERDLQDQNAKVASDLGNVEKQKENAARTAEEMKKLMEEQVGKLDKQLGELERDYQFLEKRAESVQRSYLLAGREVTALQLQSPGASGTTRTAAGGTQTRLQQQLQQRQNEMAAYELEYNATTFRMGQLAQQARGIVTQRASVIREYEAATGQLVKKNAALDKWSSRLSDKKKKLSTATTKAGSSPPKEIKIRSLAALVPFDLDGEKDRVLKSFGLTPADEEKEKQP